MAMTDDEIFTKVQGVLEDALGVDDDEVTMEATLGPDLGAESIDYLDIVFRLEKAFGLKIDQAELMPNDVLTDPAYVEDGKITDKGMAELKAKMPHADLSAVEESRDVEDFEKAFTVRTLVEFVKSKI
ncbi:acyl carrier protein [Phycisphaera mikurensis]|uniref:Putative acyl carrier protein n=1 Tax=Phycisphaera mikurensis (strain NBRC 102666 / KCTC 22515 / FYK2301M01) TaxID=1142394 RepID=I0IH32_PHYMF|nr:phosphopantetheine-binding protein [Phycisphaera mikurensis]MBB6440825.1 acyl carrier protein [Phycisphaera mikurensis]BAM04570.1 putative acyl carrier protein [Phycisphaera mikurensis NBRC 102666]